MEVLILLGFVVVLITVLAWLDAPPRNRARYSGRVFDPQLGAIRRAGAVPDAATWNAAVARNARVVICGVCGAATWGLSDACGRCGVVGPSSSGAAAEGSVGPSAVALQDDLTDVRGLIPDYSKNWTNFTFDYADEDYFTTFGFAGPTPEQKARIKRRVMGSVK
jgi:hypothetical protein